jgi:hypothetical protein
MNAIEAERRIQGEHDILFLVPSRTCTVSFTDTDGLRHSVNVQAATLCEAVARAFREHQRVPTPVSAFEVESPADRIMRERLKGMMAS